MAETADSNGGVSPPKSPDSPDLYPNLTEGGATGTTDVADEDDVVIELSERSPLSQVVFGSDEEYLLFSIIHFPRFRKRRVPKSSILVFRYVSYGSCNATGSYLKRSGSFGIIGGLR